MPSIRNLESFPYSNDSPKLANVRELPKSRSRGPQPDSTTLIALTLLTACLLLPFALSPLYLDFLREKSIELHQLLRGELYKQITGYSAVFLILVEILLTVRKRSRGWPIAIQLKGSVQFWRSVHIFVGVGLVAMVSLHTLGSRGLNFNAMFLWVFFGVTLTALVGVVAETSLLESTRRYFGQLPDSTKPLTTGSMVRWFRGVWLASHIFLVWVFALMLIFHIILVYYFQ